VDEGFFNSNAGVASDHFQMPVLDPLPPVTTVSLRVSQFIALYKPFVADFNVPAKDVLPAP